MSEITEAQRAAIAASSSSAPADATYITQTANGTLTNEQALSSLTTGLVKVTTGTGVLSTAVASDVTNLIGAVAYDAHYFRQIGTSPERYYPAGMIGAATLTTASVTLGTMFAIPFFSVKGNTLDRMLIDVSSGSSGTLFRVGLYASTSATNLYPGALLVGSAEQSFTSTSGVFNTTVSATLAANTLYWAVFLCDTAVSSMRTTPISSMCPILGITNAGGNLVPGIGWSVTQAYGALPDPFTASGAVMNTLVFPMIALRFSA